MKRPLAGKRIGLVTFSASRLGGGVFEAVAAQAALIARLGGEAVVFAPEDCFSAQDAHRFAGSKLVHCPVFGPGRLGYAPRLLPELLDAGLDCLHLNGIWTYASRAATSWARASGRRYLISPHGMLDPDTARRRPLRKWFGRLVYEWASWRTASAFHAVTAHEATNIRGEAGAVEVLVIPNSAPEPGQTPEYMRKPLVAFIGRIHAVKNLAGLIEGWRLAKSPETSRLVIAGWGEPDQVEQLKAMVANAGPSMSFIGPVYAAAKADLLAAARFLALPSFSEAMPMVILEGWAAGTPAILTPECNLPEGLASGAAIACSQSPDSIARALEKALALGEAEWLAMARAGQDLVREHFSSDVVGALWAKAYLSEPF